jgi:hypothetical protein
MDHGPGGCRGYNGRTWIEPTKQQGVFQQQTMGIEWKTTKKRWVKKLVLLRHHGITGTLFSDKPLFFVPENWGEYETKSLEEIT